MAPQVVHRPSLANLQLQVALYYNALYSIMFSIILGAIAMQKIEYYNKKVAISVMIVWSVIEPVRLYYGYRGNLKESVPELSTSMLITLFPQLPFVIYLAYYQPVQFPADKPLGTIMLIFVAFELLAGLYTLRQLIRTQTAQFMRLVENDEEDD